MKRRELIAGIAGVGVVAGGGVLAKRGLPSAGMGGPAGTRSDPDDAAEATSDESDDGSSDGSADSDDDRSGDGDSNGSGDGSPAQPAVETLEVETIDAPGSEAGTVSVPDLGRVTFVDFFATWCGPCEAQMPELAKAAERVSDDVTFLSVTSELVGRTLPEDELVDWWDDHDGNWTLGIDPTSEVRFHYGVTQIPTAVVIDANGAVQWSHAGTTEADVFVDQIEAARDQG